MRLLRPFDPNLRDNTNLTEQERNSQENAVTYLVSRENTLQFVAIKKIDSGG